MNDKFIDEYDREAVNKKLMNSLKSEGYNDGLIAGKSIGFDDGKKQEKIEIAKNMLDKKFDLNTIVDITGLTIEELDNLH